MSVDMDSHSSKDGSPPPSQPPPLTPPSIHSFHRPLSPSPTMGYPMPHFGKFNNSSSPLTSPPDSRSPHSSPPSLIPSSMMMQRPPPPGFISQSPLLLPRFPPMDISRSPGDYGDMRHFINRSLSPPPFSSSDPTANECKMVEYRGKKIASFVINGRTMLCLPQAFDLFLKHLVGGMHTVYCKLKRLEITQIVCNVEMIRTLRGLGAIQPGVNRCKLLADTDFDELFKDCTTQSNSRPGRPPKRGLPFPAMSPQDAMLHFKHSSMMNGDHFGSNKEARLDTYPHGYPLHHGGSPHPGFNPMAAAQFMMSHPAAQAAFLHQGIPPPLPFPPASSAPPDFRPGADMHKNPIEEAHRHAYEDMLKKIEKLREEKSVQARDIEDAAGADNDKHKEPSAKENFGAQPTANPHGEIRVKNFALSEDKPPVNHKDTKLTLGNLSGSEGDNIHTDDDIGDSDDSADEFSTPTINNNEKGGDGLAILKEGVAGVNSMHGLLGNIQEMLRLAAQNAIQQEKQLSTQKNVNEGEISYELKKEKELRSSLEKQLEEVKRNGAIYLRRFKKEKKLRRKLQEELEFESKKRAQFEDAINSVPGNDNKQQQLLQQHQHQMQKMQQEDQKEAERSRSETNVSRENSEERMNMMSPLMNPVGGVATRPQQMFPFSNGMMFTHGGAPTHAS
eukprot:TRINITY_DN9015_c0_g1_i1.p1 TRINITY_DN9015_c0_g1~~TRINITY_DN9015_c0_g1_i1.p1  ORF type:complete len:673 (+),score=131.04 TRINITY_DN9015_c0_g1_i1:378-2396(+)